MPEVVVLIGSASDWGQVAPALDLLDQLGVSSRVHVTSAHRTPARTVELIRKAETDGCQVFVCAAGMAAHLAGAVAGQTLLPVLGVPLPGGVLDGVDALLSTVQMPAGVPVATFAVGRAGAKNAAFFAAQIVARQRSEVADRLRDLRESAAEAVVESDARIVEERSR